MTELEELRREIEALQRPFAGYDMAVQHVLAIIDRIAQRAPESAACKESLPTGDNIGVLIGDKLIHNGDPGTVIGFSPHDSWVIVEVVDRLSGLIALRLHPDVARRAVDAAKERGE